MSSPIQKSSELKLSIPSKKIFQQSPLSYSLMGWHRAILSAGIMDPLEKRYNCENDKTKLKQLEWSHIFLFFGIFSNNLFFVVILAFNKVLNNIFSIFFFYLVKIFFYSLFNLNFPELFYKEKWSVFAIINRQNTYSAK